jgi:hypothetical protein
VEKQRADSNENSICALRRLQGKFLKLPLCENSLRRLDAG